MVICPCKYCEKRHFNCHNSCEEYVEYKNDCKRIKKLKKQQLELPTYFGEKYNRRRQK